jgi:hypothetical protein
MENAIRDPDSEERRIAVRSPMLEGETANEDGEACQDGIEEIEGPQAPTQTK